MHPNLLSAQLKEKKKITLQKFFPSENEAQLSMEVNFIGEQTSPFSSVRLSG